MRYLTGQMGIEHVEMVKRMAISLFFSKGVTAMK